MNQAFEAWAKKFYQECQMTINSPNHWTKPNEYMLSTYQNAWEGWQGCSQHHEAKLAEMQSELDKARELLSEARDDVAECMHVSSANHLHKDSLVTAYINQLAEIDAFLAKKQSNGQT